MFGYLGMIWGTFIHYDTLPNMLVPLSIPVRWRKGIMAPASALPWINVAMPCIISFYHVYHPQEERNLTSNSIQSYINIIYFFFTVVVNEPFPHLFWGLLCNCHCLLHGFSEASRLLHTVFDIPSNATAWRQNCPDFGSFKSCNVWLLKWLPWWP